MGFAKKLWFGLSLIPLLLAFHNCSPVKTHSDQASGPAERTQSNGGQTYDGKIGIYVHVKEDENCPDSSPFDSRIDYYFGGEVAQLVRWKCQEIAASQVVVQLRPDYKELYYSSMTYIRLEDYVPPTATQPVAQPQPMPQPVTTQPQPMPQPQPAPKPQAKPQPASVASENGICGTANGSTASSAPTANLCGAGAASIVSGTGPWFWSCRGTNGGATAQCSANKTVVVPVVDGKCGSANGSYYSVNAPADNFCQSGAATAVSGNGPWSWTCVGSGGGTTARCSTATCLTAMTANGISTGSFLCSTYRSLFGRLADLGGAQYWDSDAGFVSASSACKTEMIKRGARGEDCDRYFNIFGELPPAPGCGVTPPPSTNCP